MAEFAVYLTNKLLPEDAILADHDNGFLYKSLWVWFVQPSKFQHSQEAKHNSVVQMLSRPDKLLAYRKCYRHYPSLFGATQPIDFGSVNDEEAVGLSQPTINFFHASIYKLLRR